MIDRINQQLLNDYQHSFPLVSEPFEDLAKTLNTDAQTVLARVHALKEGGAISRIGPVFRPNTIGVSTLAAISVPTEQIDAYAAIINDFDAVNHNYQREHEINLWFVLTAAKQLDLNNTIAEIEQQTGQSVLVLPLLKEHHIDLGFKLRHLNQNQHFNEQILLDRLPPPHPFKARELAPARDLIEAIQGGLPLVGRPYQALGEQLEMSEQQVIERLKQLIGNGAIKRFGVVVRHHEMGYRANAMVVWDIPDEQVDRVGELLGNEECVTLCYQRPRVQPRWPYNLFCMIHGQDREQVLDCIEGIKTLHKLHAIPSAVLFSGKRFKQRGARYRSAQPQVINNENNMSDTH